jgi:hypothetical protein
MLTLCRQVLFILCLWHFLKFRLHLVFQIDNLFYTECPKKKEDESLTPLFIGRF